MVNGKSFTIGVLFTITLWGCVSATLPYKWYYPEFVSYQGKLLGAKPADDLDASICQNHNCVVMLKDEFKALTLDYLDLQNKLEECQKP